MRPIQDRKTKKWKFGESGQYIYDSEREAEVEGRKEISIKLNIACGLHGNKKIPK